MTIKAVAKLNAVVVEDLQKLNGAAIGKVVDVSSGALLPSATVTVDAGHGRVVVVKVPKKLALGEDMAASKWASFNATTGALEALSLKKPKVEKAAEPAVKKPVGCAQAQVRVF